ncbi:hypothetical protein L873DRAFT_1793011 [Choiromyces venosus 120613-1]|uniref:Uncharacterized protein n=1 Tax=Choiromyces venosus 120613-1 TaxID=1336337 RepID=A0A3N4JKD6_9PEZI|nr:hypothetical protein L873DRAFT_1793011 [Choiromyces venosus 120613-1]
MAKRKKRSQDKGWNPYNNNGAGSRYDGSNNNHDNGANKRHRYNSGGNVDGGGYEFDASKGYIDPTTGQRGAFPGLEGEPDDFYGPANNGMDYLRMVRSEAKGVPTLLVAGQKVRRPLPLPVLQSDTLNYDDEPEAIERLVDEMEEGEIIESQEKDDGQGWYHDGAYTAAIDPTAATPLTEPPTALSLWHGALLTSFRSVRQSLHANPPIPLLPLAVSPLLPPRKQRSLWQQHIFNTHPTPKELWGIDQQTVLRLLKWLTQRMPEIAKHKNGRCWSQWLWGLLMRLDDCLTADETSIVRELGKRCLIIRERMAIALQGGTITDDQREEEVEDDDDDEEGEEGNEEVREPNIAQDKDTIVAVATEQIEQTQFSPTAPEIEAIVKSEVAPQTEATLEPMPFLQVEKLADTEEAETPGITSRLRAALQAIRNQKLQAGPPQSEQKNNSKLNPPIVQSADTLSQSDTLGVLDMVVSLVGDFYGQKDLLADRKTPVHLSAP